jgi:hypothetical protein
MDCDGGVITYKVTIDNDFYFKSIDFVCEKSFEETVFVDGEVKTEKYIKRSTYSYVFNKYNSEVVVEYPLDLIDYTY